MRTLDVLSDVPGVERMLVISRDSRALALARENGARTLTERGAPQLNTALVRASILARGYGVTSVLFVPADLPLLTAQEIETFIAAAKKPPVVVIAPDRHGTGTNALLMSPPGLIEYDFGPDSFARHKKRAKEAGARIVVCELPSMELDLDLPEDLEILQEWQSRQVPVEAEE